MDHAFPSPVFAVLVFLANKQRHVPFFRGVPLGKQIDGEMPQIAITSRRGRAAANRKADPDKFAEKLKAIWQLTNEETGTRRPADGETGEGERTPPTSGEGVADALDRDGEGGAPAEAWPLPYKTGDCWTRSVVSWNSRRRRSQRMDDLPTDVQRRLFEHAASENHMMLRY